jgi:hypothetical protein
MLDSRNKFGIKFETSRKLSGQLDEKEISEIG